MFEALVRVLLVVRREFDGEDEQGERDDAVIRRTELLRGLDRGNVCGDAEKEKEDVLDGGCPYISVRIERGKGRTYEGEVYDLEKNRVQLGAKDSPAVIFVFPG
jgi:hypothetical protein